MSSMNEATIIDLLRVKHSPPEWLFVDHVKNAAGFGARRQLDALAFNTFGSRGYAFVGYEVKCTRADFLRELKDPEKSEAVGQFCDRFSIVAAHPLVAAPEEMPLGWGLYVVNSKGSGLLTKKRPEAREQVMPIDRPFLAAIVRRLQKQDREDFDAFAEARSEGFRQGREAEQSIQTGYKAELERLREMVQVFEKSSGVRVNSWDGGRVGEAVQLVMNGRGARLVPHARQLIESLDGARANAQKALSQLEAIKLRDEVK